MVHEGRIIGEYVSLSACEEADAEFTIAIRNDPELSRYLPVIHNTLEEQADWIRGQRVREGDYFFVVRRMDGEPIGTVSVYNIKDAVAESGRLALKGNAVEKTEAVLLLLDFAFETLGIQRIEGYTVYGNRRADRFNKQFGCVTGEPEINEAGETIRRTVITRSAFREAAEYLCKVLYNGHQLKI